MWLPLLSWFVEIIGCRANGRRCTSVATCPLKQELGGCPTTRQGFLNGDGWLACAPFRARVRPPLTRANATTASWQHAYLLDRDAWAIAKQKGLRSRRITTRRPTSVSSSSRGSADQLVDLRGPVAGAAGPEHVRLDRRLLKPSSRTGGGGRSPPPTSST